MTKRRCLVVPAVKKNAVIPDQLVKKLAGKTLIQRAIDHAKGVVDGPDVYVVTDSDEIRLICERNGVNAVYDASFRITSLNIVSALMPVLRNLAADYDNLLIYRASSPLITAEDIEDAYSRFIDEDSDCLVTVKSVTYRLWRGSGRDIGSLLFSEDEDEVYIETKALFMLRGSALDAPPSSLKVTPYFLNDRSVEIASYQDWWICEKILQSKHIVFVVAGFPAIGMGHVYRALMLAHEITDHRVTFLCTADSELAAAGIIARDYHIKMQKSDDLAAEVIRLKPDLVINDFLDTDAEYMRRLKDYGAKVVNFEDEGEGAQYADLVVNALYESHMQPSPRFLYGYRNFCLRDEFVSAARNPFRETPKEMLITFGGTDSDDFTRDTLETLYPACRERNIRISIVTGPGYAHKAALEDRIRELNGQSIFAAVGEDGASPAGQRPFVEFTHATNIMSRYMERADFAVCSAGRTVYELTHMRVPAIVMAHHQREDMHAFARSRNGFLYLGIMKPFDRQALSDAFTRMTDATYRKELFMRQNRFDFTHNKSHVVKHLLALLEDAPQ